MAIRQNRNQWSSWTEMQKGSDNEQYMDYDDEEGDDEEDENPVLVADLEVGKNVDLDISALNK